MGRPRVTDAALSSLSGLRNRFARPVYDSGSKMGILSFLLGSIDVRTVMLVPPVAIRGYAASVGGRPQGPLGAATPLGPLEVCHKGH